MKYIENIAEKVRKSEKRAGIVYANPNDKSYKVLRFIYYLSMAASVILTLMYILGQIIVYNDYPDASAALKEFYPVLWPLVIILVLWVGAIILCKLKKDIFCAFLSVVPGVVWLLIFKQQMTDVFDGAVTVEGLHNDFWLRVALPFAFVTISIISMAIIRTKSDLKFNRAYTNMLSRIYESNHSEDMSEEQWKEFLENYDPRIEEDKRRGKKTKEDCPKIIEE